MICISVTLTSRRLAAPSDSKAVKAAKKANVRHAPWNNINNMLIEGEMIADSTVQCGLDEANLILPCCVKRHDGH